MYFWHRGHFPHIFPETKGSNNMWYFTLTHAKILESQPSNNGNEEFVIFSKPFLLRKYDLLRSWRLRTHSEWERGFFDSQRVLGGSMWCFAAVSSNEPGWLGLQFGLKKGPNDNTCGLMAMNRNAPLCSFNSENSALFYSPIFIFLLTRKTLLTWLSI